MLSSISPLGEGARNSTWWITTGFYVAGSTIGGLALGGLSALVGSLVPAAWRGSTFGLLLLALVLALGVVLDRRARGGALPSWHRQVDEAWLTAYRGWVYGGGFGLQLGFGLVTIITSFTTYATVALAAWSGSLVVGLAIGATFGIVRALPSLAMRRVDDRSALHRVFGTVERLGAPVDVLARAALSAGAVALTTAALVT